jgi:hypothetical protein
MRLTNKQWRAIVQAPSVRKRLRFVADRIAARTRANLASADVDATVTVEEGTRPKGRSYARVMHNDKYGEYGTEDIPKHRALGRAIGSK